MKIYFGKIIAGGIGLLTGGIIGLLLGLLVGHFFDRALENAFGFASPENLQRIRESFFETTFLLSGYLGKVDGRVSEQEIAHTEQMFVQMGLDATQRQRAIDLFRRGAAADFEPEPVVADFLSSSGRQRQLQQALLVFLISLALADGTLEPAEHSALVRIAGLMGIGAMQLEALLNMARAGEQFHGTGPRAASPDAHLADAYGVLGVDATVSDRDLKRAYRKLMSENHPDKLIAKGVPEDMIKLATERVQDIQGAYETVRRHRGLK
ncbi:MAG: co-chaperone DjlA [Halioglobus sp.]|nr:co-chaperone DjlA [Halioglobus sp.]